MSFTKLNSVWGLFFYCLLLLLFTNLPAQNSAPCPQDFNRLFQQAQKESEKDNYSKALKLLRDAEVCDPSKEKQVENQEIKLANKWESSQKKATQSLSNTLNSLEELQEEKEKINLQKHAAERSLFEARKRELLAIEQIEEEKKQRIIAEREKAKSDSLRNVLVSQQKETQKRYLNTQIKWLMEQGSSVKAFKLAEYIFDDSPTLENSLLLNEVYYQTTFRLDSSLYAAPFYQALTLEKFDPNILDAQYAPDNTQLLITFHNNSTAMLLQQRNKRQIPIEGHTGAIISARYSPDGEYIYTISTDKSVKIWNRKGQHLTDFAAPVIQPKDLKVSTNGQYVLTAELGQSRIWDTGGTPLLNLPTSPNQQVEKIAWSNQQEYILQQYGRTIEVWRKKGKKLQYKPLFTKTFATSFNSLQFSANDQYILAAAKDGTTYILEIEGKNLTIIEVLKGHQSAVNSAYFSPKENFIITTSDDQTSKIWKWDSSTARASMIDNLLLKEPDAGLQSARFSLDESQILSVSNAGKVKIWNWQARYIPFFDGQFFAPTVSPTEPIFVSVADDVIQVRNFQNKMQSAWSHEQKDVHSLQFSANGKLLLSTAKDSTLKVWDWQKQSLLDSLKTNGSHTVAAFSPTDEEVIAIGSDDGFVRFYNWQTQSSIAELKAHPTAINALHFSKDGEYLASAADDKMAIIWNTQTAEKVLMLQGHASPVLNARFSSSGDYLVTASKDRVAKVWQTGDGDVVRLEYKGHREELLDARFLGDNELILTTSKDGTAKIWNKAGKLLQSFDFVQPILAAMPSHDLQYLLFFTTEGLQIQYLDGEKLKERVEELGVVELSEEEKEWFGLK